MKKPVGKPVLPSVEMSLTVVKFDPDGDGVTALYIGDNLNTYGDYYHDKVDDWVEGFLEGVRYCWTGVVVERYDVAVDCPVSREVCGGDSPPLRLADLKRRARTKLVKRGG